MVEKGDCALEMNHRTAVIDGKIRSCQLKMGQEECRKCPQYPDRYKEMDKKDERWPTG